MRDCKPVIDVSAISHDDRLAIASEAARIPARTSALIGAAHFSTSISCGIAAAGLVRLDSPRGGSGKAMLPSSYTIEFPPDLTTALAASTMEPTSPDAH